MLLWWPVGSPVPSIYLRPPSGAVCLWEWGWGGEPGHRPVELAHASPPPELIPIECDSRRQAGGPVLLAQCPWQEP